MADLSFLKDFKKSIADIEGIGDNSQDPRFWLSTGNYNLNKIISGSFYKGIPQGRLTALCGPSSSGKSFLGANLVANAQKEGAFALVIDSEHALADKFMTDIGVDVNNNYLYQEITTIPQVIQILSSFLQKYRKDYGNSEKAPKVIVLIDSLDMLLTERELEHFEAGESAGDQGQRNKQLKAMLRPIVQSIKDLNITVVFTSQVYKNQDLKNGEGVWLFADSTKYAASQIILLTKLKLKDTGESAVRGIRMKCEGYKTRFTKPFQTVTIEVPYDTGMNPLSGLILVAEEMKIIEKRGSRYGFVGEEVSFFSKDIAEHAERILSSGEAKRDAYLKFIEASEEVAEDQGETAKDTKARRGKKVNGE